MSNQHFYSFVVYGNMEINPYTPAGYDERREIYDERSTKADEERLHARILMSMSES